MVASNMKPEGHTASLEQRTAQPDGHELESSEQSTDSFVSAHEIIGSEGTHSGDEKPHNDAPDDPAPVAQEDTSERPALSPSPLYGEEESPNDVSVCPELAASESANVSPALTPTSFCDEGEPHNDVPGASEPAFQKTNNESTSLSTKIPWTTKVAQLDLSMHEWNRLRGFESAALKEASDRDKLQRLDTEIALMSDNIQNLERGLERERNNVQRLESEIASERGKSQSLESELRHERANLRRSESSTREIALDHGKLRGELDVSHRQLEAARKNSATPERQAHDLHFKMCEGDKGLKRQVADLTAKVRYHETGYAQTYRNGVLEGMRSLPFAYEKGVIDERVVLLQQVEAYKAEAAKWRMDAFRQGSEAISRCWQASVDEAVRRERQKDAFVMEMLRDELAVLKSKTEG
jgi:hypothetical protein